METGAQDVYSLVQRPVVAMAVGELVPLLAVADTNSVVLAHLPDLTTQHVLYDRVGDSERDREKVREMRKKKEGRDMEKKGSLQGERESMCTCVKCSETERS